MRAKKIVRRLWDAAQTLENLPEFDDLKGDDYQREVAMDLNQIRARAEYLAVCGATANGDKSDVLFCEAAIRTIHRVAEFEEIPTKTQNNHQ